MSFMFKFHFSEFVATHTNHFKGLCNLIISNTVTMKKPLFAE